MSLCDYKYALGVPGVGIHAPRFLGLAAVDLFGVLFIAAVISWCSGKYFMSTTCAVMSFVVFIHWLFCVPTALNVALGLA